MKRWRRGAIALSLGLMCPAYGQTQGTPATAETETETEAAAWLINSLSESFAVVAGGTLRLRHAHGDVRVEAAETDRIHVTALAQYHRDDPRAPSIRFVPGEAAHELVVEFAHLEIAENEAWTKRRIDVGLLVPLGLAVDIETDRGLIEVKKIEAQAELASDRGDIIYRGAGSLTARTERGSMRVLLLETSGGRSADLSTLTGDIWCMLLEGASADVTLETRGPVTTDYSVEIDREAGSPLKKGRIRVGQDGTRVSLTSHSGGIRLQGLIVPEDEG